MLLAGEKLKVFDVEQGVAQGCSLSPILSNGVFVEVKQLGFV